jgi:hypothetical protein
MNPKKLDRIISIIREEMMTANPPGGSGAFSDSGDPKTRGGFSPVLGLERRRGPQIKLPPGSRKRWKKSEQ